MLTVDEINDVHQIVRTHKPSQEDAEKILFLSESVKQLLLTIMKCCPPCADRSAAIRKVREAMMTANASIVMRNIPLG